jgi:hypothetical protein
MKTYTAFNRAELITGTLTLIQQAKEEEIADRLKDRLEQAGILMPASATAIDIQDGIPTVFVISNAGSGNINVGAGIAYNSNAERIEILSGDSTPYNADTSFPNVAVFTTTITGVGSIQGNTPFSSGRLTIPPRDALNSGERFVFVRYRQVVRTKSLPPNHNTSSGTVITIAGGDPDTKKPYLELDQKEGLIYAPHYINGYEIIVALQTELTPGTQTTGTPVLASDTNAIYIGRYDYTGGAPGSVGTITLSDNARPRLLMLIRTHESAKVDSTNQPTTYDDGQRVTLQEHTSALGTGVIAPTNPHGLAITDITGGGTEPENIVYQKESMNNGLIDVLNTTNNPIPASEALEPTIVNTPLIGPAFLAYVSCTQFDTTRHALYISGERFSSIINKLSTYSGNPADTQAIVGFLAGDPAGTYNIYVNKATTGVVLLQKLISTSALPADSLLLFTVYWTGAKLLKDANLDESLTSPIIFPTPYRPIDKRSLGLIGKRNMSTEGMSDPLNGIFAQQGVTDLLYDGNMQMWYPYSVAINSFSTVNGRPWMWDLGLLPGSSASVSSCLLKDVLLDGQTSGPKVTSAAKIHNTTATGGIFHAHYGGGLVVGSTPLGGLLFGIKPNTNYTVTIWFKITAPGTPNVPVSTTIVPTVRILRGGDWAQVSNMQTCILAQNSITWQKVTVTLTTDSTVNPAWDLAPAGTTSSSQHYLDIQFISNITPFVAADIYVTGMSVVEGEWLIEKPKKLCIVGADGSIRGSPLMSWGGPGGAQTPTTWLSFAHNGGPVSIKGELQCTPQYSPAYWDFGFYAEIALYRNGMWPWKHWYNDQTGHAHTINTPFRTPNHRETAILDATAHLPPGFYTAVLEGATDSAINPPALVLKSFLEVAIL